MEPREAKPGMRVRIKEDAPMEEAAVRGVSGTIIAYPTSAGYARMSLDFVTEGFDQLLVHPESLEEITS